MQVESFFCAASGQSVQVTVSKPLATGCGGLALHLVAVIPNEIRRRCLRVKPRGVLVSHTVAIRVCMQLSLSDSRGAPYIPGLKAGVLRRGLIIPWLRAGF